MDHLPIDEQRRFWIAYPEADNEICGTKEVMEQERAGVKILFQMSDKTCTFLANSLTSVEEYVQ
jgi:hypothetical protein